MAEIRDESVIMERGVSLRVCTRTGGAEKMSQSSVGIVLIKLNAPVSQLGIPSVRSLYSTLHCFSIPLHSRPSESLGVSLIQLGDLLSGAMLWERSVPCILCRCLSNAIPLPYFSLQLYLLLGLQTLPPDVIGYLCHSGWVSFTGTYIWYR